MNKTVSAAAFAAIVAAGCNSGGQGSAPGYSKADVAKTAPPAGFLANAPVAPPAGAGAPE